jgi:type II restriction/modification system DNA methylase subunit YeeA
METARLKRFAQFARRSLLEQVSAKLKLVLGDNSAARREKLEAIQKLEEAVKNQGQEQVIERVAYTWFNRFCALRFMDVNRYSRIGVVSPSEGQFQPEILAEAKMGHIDEEMVGKRVQQQILALLDGKAPSLDPQGEAYRLLVVAVCNYWNKAMPFLFQRIDDYTELLMPDDLLSGNSVLTYVREAMTPAACEDVEVIGWLYQFYISEKKDEVFDGLKKNKKIIPENIPAATQLFTPHWIVRYLVENSLGRLWLLNRPSSKLAERMDYYIKPEESETDFLRIDKPEEIKICDPACGSGHMLTYAFDLLYSIYEEEGYEAAEISEKILSKNLFGIEIDERAGELAAFALIMKARSKQRRFFNKFVQPNICVLENVNFDETELQNYKEAVGDNLFSPAVQEILSQFQESENFGSLIRPGRGDIVSIGHRLNEKNVGQNLFLHKTHERVLQALRFAEYVNQKYHIVIANPPYMGNRSFNLSLQDFARLNYKHSKADTFAMFIERNLDFALNHGIVAMITMQSWMFLSSFEKLRERILQQGTILCMAHLGSRAFDSIGGEIVSTTAFILRNSNQTDYQGIYLRLVEGKSEDKKAIALREGAMSKEWPWRYKASSADFQKIPGCPIAYWVSAKLRNIFAHSVKLSEVADTCAGLQTSDNDRFLRLWFEVNWHKVGIGMPNRAIAKDSKLKWFPCTKGGSYRRWFGNNEYVVNWERDGAELFAFAGELYGSATRIIKNANRYFEEGLTWSSISSTFAMRYTPAGFIFETKGSMCFAHTPSDAESLLALANTRVVEYILGIFSPTLDFHEGPLGKVPVVLPEIESRSEVISRRAVEIVKNDWDSFETSWDFDSSPLLKTPFGANVQLAERYAELRKCWHESSIELRILEEKNNRFFIESYGLTDELSSSVPLSEITLSCNPQYRYGNEKSDEELEQLLLADTMRELVSYAVGCMFGRYSLDKHGLLLANQGETIEDYLKHVPEPSFAADNDNVIPMLDGDWFTDDIAERFRKFLRVAFGDKHYDENLRFIEKALNIKGKRDYSIRDYFLGEFYSDHVKRYKKRPIYWLFSSPKSSFNALIYMHRYRPDTVSVVLNDYLREFRTKLTSHKNHLEAVSISAGSSQGEKTKALKEIEKINKMIAEMEEYEREVLYPLATEQVEINLDDGVKVNYPKLGTALKKIVGLDAIED